MFPTGSVNNVTANTEANSIELAWSSPANFSDDGTFSGYIITCNNTENNNTISDDFIWYYWHQKIYNISVTPFTLYKCCILPQWTTNGVGPSVCIEQQTLEDGQYNNSQSVAVNN